MRRIAIALLAAAAFGCAKAENLGRADPERMAARIAALSEFGRNADGGVDRVAYTRADIEARAWAMETMRSIGLHDVRIDAGGNIRGVRHGTDDEAKPIMFGSHIDSVPGGGNYDGDVGVVAAFEAIELLNAASIETKSPLEVVIFSNEEGGLIGSLALTGALSAATLDEMSGAGVAIREGIRAIGGDPDALARDVVAPGALKAFIEVHIEQGAILDEENVDIGVVEGIVGIEWWNVTLEGVANHAGTTPMNRRKDALLAAARLIGAVNQTAVETPGAHVATVGRIRAFPGAPNVIPGKVEMSLEIRDLDAAKIESLFAAIEEKGRAIAAESGVAVAFERLDVASAPARTDERVRAAIAEAAETLGLSTRAMASGAGHDAQDMARIAPTGMIFVPSVGGVSHSPKEFTEPKDMANGADVLVRTILALDRTK